MSAPAVHSALDPARLVSGPALLSDLAPALHTASSGAMPVAVRPHYLRLKPGRSALVGLRIDWRDGDRASTTLASLYVGPDAPLAAAKARTRRLLTPSLGPAVLELPALPAVLVSFPNDRVLKGLSAAADPRRLGNRLAGDSGAWAAEGWRVRARHTEVECVRWKPERRAVLRADLSLRDDTTGARARETVWVRVHGASERAAREMAWRAAAQVPGLAVPGVRWSDAERGLLVVADVAGRAFAGTADESGWAELGRSLAALHASPAPAGLAQLDDAASLEAAMRTLESLGALVPGLFARTQELRAALARRGRELESFAPAFVHGDLTADQAVRTADGLVLMDWDEAACGDPHADYAALAADLAERGADAREAAGRAEVLAHAALGSRAEPARFRWHLGLAHARRALSGLQRARADWEAEAERALERAGRALNRPRLPRPEAPPAREAALRAVLDPAVRAGLPGTDGRVLALAAVWPAGTGAHARFEDPDRPGVPVLWLELDEQGTAAHPFPADPALPAMADRLARGERAAGHRFGRRAALRSADGGTFHYLRPANTLAKAWRRVRDAHAMLERAGVPHAAPVPGRDGWTSRAARGAAWPARWPGEADWCEAGAQIARVHALGRARPVADALALVREAGEAQVALVALVDPALAVELGGALAASATDVVARGTPAWIHGDLHPGQLATGEETLWLDWERARAGEAEADLGNLAAHLAWERPEGARLAWTAFASGYRGAGGAWSAERFVAHAVAALARVRAIHSWRDAGRARAVDSKRWRNWREEVSSW